MGISYMILCKEGKVLLITQTHFVMIICCHTIIVNNHPDSQRGFHCSNFMDYGSGSFICIIPQTGG